MTEKEKMLSGEFYDTRDPELRAMSSRAKDLMRVYNSLPAENMELRDQMVRMLLGDCGGNVRVNQPIYVDYGCNISLGTGSLINKTPGRITVPPPIGDNTIIGAGSVVTHAIPADSVACGNPCIVRKAV